MRAKYGETGRNCDESRGFCLCIKKLRDYLVSGKRVKGEDGVMYAVPSSSKWSMRINTGAKR